YKKKNKCAYGWFFAVHARSGLLSVIGLLREGETLIFANKIRGFRRDVEGLAKRGLKDQESTEKTLSKDFARNRQIQNC
ncbi:hypothetical protein, partial [Escherichia coli]|uniref:hypothetical protein n=1 Tax=Escherichia coli TaxID=562 RepID=UPI001BAF41A6